jgi:hypothetical protein
MTRNAMLALAALAAASVLTACGERPQVVTYKQGQYQGKPDTRPFAGAPWNGNQKEWDGAIRTRNQAQNEYKRTGG